MRKIIQIAVAAGEEWTEIHALCDDGTLWRKNDFEKKWEIHTQVPQPEKEYHPRPDALPVSGS